MRSMNVINVVKNIQMFVLNGASHAI